MKRELSEVLSEIDDPEIIEKVLNLAEIKVRLTTPKQEIKIKYLFRSYTNDFSIAGKIEVLQQLLNTSAQYHTLLISLNRTALRQ